jgi:hypothetical protein
VGGDVGERGLERRAGERAEVGVQSRLCTLWTICDSTGGYSRVEADFAFEDGLCIGRR